MQKRSATLEKPATAKPRRDPSIPPSLEADLPPCDVKCLLEATIRMRAYHKWEAAGRPPGDGVNFWLDAERELLTAP